MPEQPEHLLRDPGRRGRVLAGDQPAVDHHPGAKMPASWCRAPRCSSAVCSRNGTTVVIPIFASSALLNDVTSLPASR